MRRAAKIAGYAHRHGGTRTVVCRNNLCPRLQGNRKSRHHGQWASAFHPSLVHKPCHHGCPDTILHSSAARAGNGVLNPGPQHRRREGQRRILFVVDMIHALRLRIIAMPVWPRVGRVLRYPQAKDRVNVVSRLDCNRICLVGNRAPPLWYFELQRVDEQPIFRSVVKIHRHQKLLPR